MSDGFVMVKVEDLSEVIGRLGLIEKKLQSLSETETPEPEERVTRDDIVRELGISRPHLFNNPWYLPRFGEPDIPGRPAKWFRSTWDEWKKDLPRHKTEWEELNR